MNYKESLYNLADIHKEGLLIRKDIQLAITYYTRSAELGEVDSMVALGEIYRDGEEKLPVDHEKSFEWFYKAFKFYFQNDLTEQFFIDKQLRRLVSLRRIKWKEEFHKFWTFKQDFTEKLILLLMISKYRPTKMRLIIPKGIIMLIIQNMCHLEQL